MARFQAQARTRIPKLLQQADEIERGVAESDVAAHADAVLPDEAASGRGKARGEGMSWQGAMKEAERYVTAHSYPGVDALAEIVRCASSTMSKAISRSKMLTEHKEKHEAVGGVRETPLTDIVLDNAAQTTEMSPLAQLIADQEADERADSRAPTRRRSR